MRSWHTGKPKKKPGYDPDAVTEELVRAVVDAYERVECYEETDECGAIDKSGKHPALQSIVDSLRNYHLNPMKVRRSLITAESVAGHPVYEGTAKCEQRIREIGKLRRQGKGTDELAKLLGISKAAVLSYSPYSKIIYGLDRIPDGEKSVDADRQELYRKRKSACKKMMDEPNNENLWDCIVAFEGYPFRTVSGLEFSYRFKENRFGEKGNEIAVSRKEKTITRSSVEKALAVVMGRGEIPAGMSFPARMSTPKELGVFGASYIYPLFIRIGLVEHVGRGKHVGRSRCRSKK